MSNGLERLSGKMSFINYRVSKKENQYSLNIYILSLYNLLYNDLLYVYIYTIIYNNKVKKIKNYLKRININFFLLYIYLWKLNY